MKIKYHLIWILALLLLTACAAVPAAEKPEPTVPVPTVEQIQETAAPTEAVGAFDLAAEPEFEKADGNMVFYLNEKPVYSGGPMADVIAAGIYTDYDLNEVLEPLHFSGVIQVQAGIPGESGGDRGPMVYVVAMNPTRQLLPVSECLIYSIMVNYEDGISFGRGKTGEPFVSGVSTMKEILEAYGEPTQMNTAAKVTEIAYYGLFDCAYFTFSGDTVKQISTYYSANVFGGLAETFDGVLPDTYYGADCWVLMDQYLDVDSYLDARQEITPTGELPGQISLNGETIQLGGRCVDLPAPFGETFNGLQIPLDGYHYVRMGIKNEEEFYLINPGNTYNTAADKALVKGVITESCTYTNWGTDNSGYLPFDYQGITQDSTIEDVLAQFGAPQELVCASHFRTCFAWLHYEDTNGNTLRIRVDPIVNRVVELRLSMYFKGEKAYQ